MKKEDRDEELEKLKKEIQNKEEEISELKERIEKLSRNGRENEFSENNEVNETLTDVSDLVKSCFNVFGLKNLGNEIDRKTSGLSDLMNNLNNLVEKSEGLQKEFEVNEKKGVVDFHLSIRPVKKSMTPSRSPYKVRPHLKETKPKAPPLILPKIDMEKEEEPVIEIIDEEKVITVLVELPGVTEKDIKWDADGGTLTVMTNGPLKYSKSLELPSTVDWKDAESTFKNSVLMLSFKKSSEEHDASL